MKKQTKIKSSYKKFIHDWIDYYEKQLGVYDFSGEIIYMGEDIKEGDKITNAEIRIDHRYLKADYYIYPYLLNKFKEKYGKESIKQILAHEVSHLATHKMYYMASSVYKDEGETIDAWESMTERFGRLLYKIGELKKKK